MPNNSDDPWAYDVTWLQFFFNGELKSQKKWLISHRLNGKFLIQYIKPLYEIQPPLSPKLCLLQEDIPQQLQNPSS